MRGSLLQPGRSDVEAHLLSTSLSKSKNVMRDLYKLAVCLSVSGQLIIRYEQ